jgi:transposase
MGAPVSIVLQRSERKKYEQLCRSGKTRVRLKERLTIVLLANDGLNNGEIAQELSISAHMAGRWRKRFAKAGLSGIEKNLPRGNNHGGKNTRAQARLRQKIIAKTTTERPPNAAHWSTRTLAKVLGTSHNFVAKVWRECGFKPHLISQFKISNDPQFTEKLEDVVGLYLSPPDNAIIFCIDEKSSIQALDRTQPGLPLKKGRSETMTHDYKRHGTSTLFAALDVLTGKVIGECTQRHRHQEFLGFLKTVEKQTPKAKALHVIVDNYSTPASCINDLPESDFRLKKAGLSGQNDVCLKFTRGGVKPQQEHSPIFTVGVLRQL